MNIFKNISVLFLNKEKLKETMSRKRVNFM